MQIITFLIVAIILFLVAILFFSLILYIIFKNKECKLKESNLKKEWNDLSLYDFEKINLPIEHISFIDEKFEKIMFLFNDFAELYSQKMSDIKEKIYKLPKTLENYDWKSFKKIYCSAQMEIKVLKSSLTSLFNIQQNILEYKDYISYILVAYRENSWNLINFYNNNLSDDTKDLTHIKVVKRNVVILRNAAEELNNCIENYDINVTINALNNINGAFCDLWNAINKMYISRKQNNYINYSINEIKNILKNNYKSIKTSVINEAEKQISKVIKNQDYIKINSHKLSEKESQKLTLSIIKTLWKVKKDLNITFKSSEFFNKNKSDIDKSFTMAANYIPEMMKIFKKIYDNFIEDKEVKDLVLSCNANFSLILSEITDYKKQINRNNYDPSELLKKAKKIIQMIVDGISDSDEIISQIITKYNFSKKVLNDITSNKLLLTQMEAFMIKNKMENIEKFEWVKRLSNELNEVENKFFNEKSNNLQYSIASLAEIKSDIWTLREVLIKTHILKVYTEKIINYACLKIALDDNAIKYKLDKPLELYNECKYKESALSMLSQMKK